MPRSLVLRAPDVAKGVIDLAAATSPGVTQVKYVIDDREVGYSAAGGTFPKAWDSRNATDGTHTVYAKARDERGWFNGPKSKITVANRLPAPLEYPARPGFAEKPTWKQDFAADATAGAEFWRIYGSTLDAYQNGWKDSSKRGTYSRDHLYVKGGALHIPLFFSDGVHHVAAPTPKLPGGDVLYGRFLSEVSATGLMGDYKIAHMLWPDDPEHGEELDFPEKDLGVPGVRGYAHCKDKLPQQQWWSYHDTLDFLVPHMFEILWTPSGVEFLLDGRSMPNKSTNAGAWVGGMPKVPMHVVWQCETLYQKTRPLSGNTPGEVLIHRGAYFPLA